jgi:outer membrane protein assembly factor BamB
MGRGGKSGKRLVLATLGVVGALVFAGCDWPMFGFDAAHSGFSPDKAINSANVSTLRQLFTSPGQFGSPVEGNGVVYVGNESGNLDAFDANGVTNCSGTPNQCSPLWTGSTAPNDAPSAPAVANGVVYLASASGPTLYAFDANGVTKCSGPPKVCQPMWTATTHGASSVVVVNGVVYVGGDGVGGGSAIEAFDANGVTNCSGTPKTCTPLWTSSSNVGFSSPAVANGVLYATGEDETLYAFSANGTTNCSGTPTTCNPLWTAPMYITPDPSPASPTVSNGIVYDQAFNGLFAFDAGGTANCLGSPKTCSPLWTAPEGSSGGDGQSLAVANGIAYAPNSAGVAAFDANALTNCSGTPKTCTPLWTDNAGPVQASSPSIANGLVFIGQGAAGSSGAFMAFDAGGVINCSGTPKACQPLWTVPTSQPAFTETAIANGKIYGTTFDPFPGSSVEGALYAWELPPPTTYVAIPSNNATASGTQLLDAGASAEVTQVQYEVTGGNLNHSVIGTATPTYYGWLANWNTTTVPNGTYTLQSVASYGGEVSGSSTPISVTVQN